MWSLKISSDLESAEVSKGPIDVFFSFSHKAIETRCVSRITLGSARGLYEMPGIGSTQGKCLTHSNLTTILARAEPGKVLISVCVY